MGQSKSKEEKDEEMKRRGCPGPQISFPALRALVRIGPVSPPHFLGTSTRKSHRHFTKSPSPPKTYHPLLSLLLQWNPPPRPISPTADVIL